MQQRRVHKPGPELLPERVAVEILSYSNMYKVTECETCSAIYFISQGIYADTAV